jgi:hypothetical protein
MDFCWSRIFLAPCLRFVFEGVFLLLLHISRTVMGDLHQNSSPRIDWKGWTQYFNCWSYPPNFWLCLRSIAVVIDLALLAVLTWIGLAVHRPVIGRICFSLPRSRFMLVSA